MYTAPQPRLIIFDLDGTLIDSSVDLCNSINAALTHFGKPPPPEPVIASYIGDGASMLVRRALGDPEGDIHDEQVKAGHEGRPDRDQHDELRTLT